MLFRRIPSLDEENTPISASVKHGGSFRAQSMAALGTDVLIFIILVLCVEVSLRLFIPQAQRFKSNRDFTSGYPIVYNSLGLRDGEIKKDFPRDGVRILILGNSVTFGVGVAAEETFSEQLQASLEDRDGRIPYDIINGGGQGSNMDTGIAFIEKEGVGLAPDAVVLVLTPSNVAQEKIHKGKGLPNVSAKTLMRKILSIPFNIHVFLSGHSLTYVAFDNLLRQSLFCIGLMKENLHKRVGAIFAYGWSIPENDLEEALNHYAGIEAKVRELKRVLDRNNIPLFMVSIPSRFEISDLSIDNHRNVDTSLMRIRPGERFKEIADDLGIPFLDILDTFRKTRKEMVAGDRDFDPLYVAFDSTHLNPLGHKLVAQDLRDLLSRHGIMNAVHQPLDRVIHSSHNGSS